MAKITLAKPKLSSDELDRMLGSDTTTDISATNRPSDESVSATNNSRGQYINQYKKDHYDVLRISLPKGVKAVLQQEAKERNISVTNMILQSLTQYLGKDVSSTNGE